MLPIRPLYEIRQPGGHWQLPSDPFPLNPASRELYHALSPIQVFSCWNGITSVVADVFLPPMSLRFRDAGWKNLTAGHLNNRKAELAEQRGREAEGKEAKQDADTKPAKEAIEDLKQPQAAKNAKRDQEPRAVAKAPPSQSEEPSEEDRLFLSRDSQSECFLLSSDLWKHSRGKILIAPRARVAYEVAGYEKVRMDNATTIKDVHGRTMKATPESGLDDVDSAFVLQYDRALDKVVIRADGQGGTGRDARQAGERRSSPTDFEDVMVWKEFPPKLVASYPYADWAAEVRSSSPLGMCAHSGLGEQEWIPPF